MSDLIAFIFHNLLLIVILHHLAVMAVLRWAVHAPALGDRICLQPAVKRKSAR